MPVTRQATGKSLEILHLYRHILRECSYLPPAFRSVIVTTIQDRFQRNRKYDPRRDKHAARASNVLRMLRAANAGDKTAMQGLITRGFGRVGSRRRELMSSFVVNQGPSDSKALESLLTDIPTDETAEAATKTKKPRKNAFFHKWDQQKLLKALSSQKTQQKNTKLTATWHNRPIRSTEPDQFVPKTNIWGNKPADSLVETKRAAWWRRNAEKLMPPLANGEWDLLKRLSLGAQEEDEWKVPQRRSPATGTETPSPSSWESYALRPGAAIERAKNRQMQKRSGETDEGPHGYKTNGKLSNRWFRRQYNRTWQLTPTMKQDPNNLQYTFTWGSSPVRVVEATQDHLDVFQGVDKRGKLPSDNTSKKSKS